MAQEFVIKISQESVVLALLLAAPPLGFGLAVGFIISIMQATTQIQEQTLTFVPKIVAVLLAVLFFGSWMLTQLVSFTLELYSSMAGAVY